MAQQGILSLPTPAHQVGHFWFGFKGWDFSSLSSVVGVCLPGVLGVGSSMEPQGLCGLGRYDGWPCLHAPGAGHVNPKQKSACASQQSPTRPIHAPIMCQSALGLPSLQNGEENLVA
jgi:hypothetical protein